MALQTPHRLRILICLLNFLDFLWEISFLGDGLHCHFAGSPTAAPSLFLHTAYQQYCVNGPSPESPLNRSGSIGENKLGILKHVLLCFCLFPLTCFK